MSQPRPLTLQEKIYYLSISILLNTFGNALTISMNMGSSMWTAASVNICVLGMLFKIQSIFLTIFLFNWVPSCSAMPC